MAECQAETPRCYRCRNFGHLADECRRSMTCFNCREPEHISTFCDKPRKRPDATPSKGKVFALTGAEPDTPVQRELTTKDSTRNIAKGAQSPNSSSTIPELKHIALLPNIMCDRIL
ncbi:hypothetical protein P8452_62040 [Trifolium repens]|nr:hypothetical protein P8452_62040 [Trifolium repens]